jgi:hypothetical protein
MANKSRYTEEELRDHRREYQRQYRKNGPKYGKRTTTATEFERKQRSKYYQEIEKPRRKEKQERSMLERIQKMNPFSAYIHFYLYENNMTLLKLANRLEVDSTTLCKMLNCDRAIPVTKFYDLSVIVETNMTDLYKIYKSALDSVKDKCGDSDE